MKRIALLFTLLLVPLSTSALNLDYPTLPGGFELEDATTLPGIVAWLYTLFVGISGLAAFVMIVWGGVQWMTSQGNPGSTGDAKDKIKMALLGLLLVLASFLILQIINPELTLLRNPLPSSSLPKTNAGTLPTPPSETTPSAQDGVYLCKKDACAGDASDRLLVGNALALVENLGVWNERATALKIQGPFAAFLYENSKGAGRVICFARSVDDLESYKIESKSNNGWDNDVSSVEVLGPGACPSSVEGKTFLNKNTLLGAASSQ